MNKTVYVIKDKISGEIVNTFLANNDEVAIIVVERSLEKIPMYGDIQLFSVQNLRITEDEIFTLSEQKRAFLVKTFYKNKKRR